jgi:hypothetical protein
MARFFTSGRYGNGSRNYWSAGGRNSIDHAHTRGWNAGVEVECFAMTDDNGNAYDRFDVYMTPGSTGNGHRVLVGQVIEPVSKAGKRLAPRWRPAKGRKSVR